MLTPFRTMLLNSLQGSTDQSSLNETSTKFAAKLEQLIIELSTSGDTVSNRR